MPGTKASAIPLNSSSIAGATLIRRANSAAPASTASRIRKIWKLPSTLSAPSHVSEWMPILARLRQIEIELRQRSGIIRPPRRVQDFDPHNAALMVIIDDDAIRDFRAVLDGTVGQVDIDGICFSIHSHAHGLVLSK